MVGLYIIAGLIVLYLIYMGITKISENNKAEKEQQELTEKAQSAMSTHHYIKEFPPSCGWTLVQLASFRLAFVDSHGSFLNNEIFTSASSFENDVAIVRRLNSSGEGLLSSTGKYIIQCSSPQNATTHLKRIYDGIYEYKKVFYANSSTIDHIEKYLIKADGTYINKDFYYELIEIKDNYFKVKYRDGRIAELDFSGKFLSRPFKKKVDLGDGLFRVRDVEYGWGIYDKNKDEIIIPCKYAEILYYKPLDLFILKPFGDGTQSFPAFAVNRKNEIVVPQKYDAISILEHKYIKVSNYNKEKGMGLLSGIVNLKGDILVQPKYVNIWPSESGFMVTNGIDNARCGYVGKDGYADLEYETYSPVYFSEWDCSEISMAYSYTDDSKPYTESFACKPQLLIVAKNGKKGVVNLDNKIIVPLEYDEIEVVQDTNLVPGYFIIQNNDHYGLLDINGNQLLPMRYKMIEGHYEGEGLYQALYHLSDEKVFMNSKKVMDELKHEADYQRGRTVYFEVTLNNGNIQYILPNGLPYGKQPKVSAPKTQSKPVLPSQEDRPSKQKQSQCKYLFFDTETTGVPLDYNAPTSNLKNWPRLVQLSWIITDENYSIISKNDHIIYPDGFSIPSDAARIHGITTQKAKEIGENIITVIDSFMNDFNAASFIVGHNISFDKKIIGAELIRLGRKDVMNSKPSICTMEASTNYCKIPGTYGYKWPKLQELHTKLFGCEFEDAHNSMSDISATLKCFIELKRIGVIK